MRAGGGGKLAVSSAGPRLAVAAAVLLPPDIELDGRRLTPHRACRTVLLCTFHNLQVSPKAGNMNAAIFPNSPGEEPVIGDGARIVVVNDARHRLKTEFLQRTVPYFFKLDRRTGKKYEWADVGFVQTPQRFEDLKDGDPLGNHAVLT